MRKWNNLNSDEQEKAVDKALDILLREVVEGSIKFNDALNRDTLQSDINTAMNEANDRQTPWFAGEYIMKAVGETLKGIAGCDAEDAFYPGHNERIIRLYGG